MKDLDTKISAIITMNNMIIDYRTWILKYLHHSGLHFWVSNSFLMLIQDFYQTHNITQTSTLPQNQVINKQTKYEQLTRDKTSLYGQPFKKNSKSSSYWEEGNKIP